MPSILYDKVFSSTIGFNQYLLNYFFNNEKLEKPIIEKSSYDIANNKYSMSRYYEVRPSYLARLVGMPSYIKIHQEIDVSPNKFNVKSWSEPSFYNNCTELMESSYSENTIKTNVKIIGEENNSLMGKFLFDIYLNDRIKVINNDLTSTTNHLSNNNLVTFDNIIRNIFNVKS
jgi:hypothetical protein